MEISIMIKNREGAIIEFINLDQILLLAKVHNRNKITKWTKTESYVIFIFFVKRRKKNLKDNHNKNTIIIFMIGYTWSLPPETCNSNIININVKTI